MRKWLLRLAYAAAVLAPVGALANYAASVGAGTNFGSVVIGGVHFVSGLICDFTTANQCAAVKAASTPAAATDPALVVQNAQEHTDLAQIITNTGAAIPAGTNQVGFVGLQSNTTGGCTPTRVLSAASTNSTSVKGSAGTVCSITIIQNTATAADFRLYDSASAPTCSSATGVVANYGIQANTSSPGLSPNLGPFGLNFATGIGFCLTAYDGTDTNNSNSVTGIQINIAYK